MKNLKKINLVEENNEKGKMWREKLKKDKFCIKYLDIQIDGDLDEFVLPWLEDDAN